MGVLGCGDDGKIMFRDWVFKDGAINSGDVSRFCAIDGVDVMLGETIGVNGDTFARGEFTGRFNKFDHGWFAVRSVTKLEQAMFSDEPGDPHDNVWVFPLGGANSGREHLVGVEPQNEDGEGIRIFSAFLKAIVTNQQGNVSLRS